MTWRPWTKNQPTQLACYVAPDTAQAVSRLRLPEPPPGTLEQTLEAIYLALRHRDPPIHYAPSEYYHEKVKQIIRSPAEILVAPGRGTCLDLAILFSSLCLKHDLLPLLVVVHGHALVAVSLQKRRPAWQDDDRRGLAEFEEGQGVLRDGEALRRWIDDGDYAAVECTGFARTDAGFDAATPEGEARDDGLLGFERAVQAGREQLDEARGREFEYALDLASLLYYWKLRPFEVEQGTYLQYRSVTLEDAQEAELYLSHLDRERRDVARGGSVARRFDPLVLVNRARQIEEISRLLEQSANVLVYILGLAGMGKSTLARGVLELRRKETSAIWITCEAKGLDQILHELNAGLGLKLDAVLEDPGVRPQQRVRALLAAMGAASLVVLDGFESLLEAGGDYRQKEMGELMEGLLEYEHGARVLITTRRLPQGAGRGAPGLEIMNLGGLELEHATALFHTRSGLSPEEMQTVISEEAFARLDGHPKFIELLAGVIHELVPETLERELLDATDIGEYVLEQLLSRLTEAEIHHVQAASVFRDLFPFAGLQAVYGTIHGGAAPDPKALRSLVRRAVFEPQGQPVGSYFLHPIIRDAVRPGPEIEAKAHDAAAGWALDVPFEASDPTTWEDGLYHRCEAARLGGDEPYLSPLRDFLLEHDDALLNAGWGRRVLEALIESLQIRNDPVLRLKLGIHLYDLDLPEGALDVLQPLSEAYREALSDVDAADREAIATNLLACESTLGGVFTGYYDDPDRAQEVADRMKAYLMPEVEDSVYGSLLLANLEFNIARLRDTEPTELLTLANRVLDLAKELARQDGQEAAGPWLAKAHFYVARSLIRKADDDVSFLLHIEKSLEIHLELGSLLAADGSLFNYGAMLEQISPEAAGALLLVWTQLREELHGFQLTGWQAETASEAIAHLLESPDRIDEGRRYLEANWSKLVDFFDRGLSRVQDEEREPTEQEEGA